MSSVFNPISPNARYVSLWISLLDNYMHEFQTVADDWAHFRQALVKYSKEKKESLVKQFIEKNVAEKFVSLYGSGEVHAYDIVPRESIDSFCEIIMTRLDPETLQYV